MRWWIMAGMYVLLAVFLSSCGGTPSPVPKATARPAEEIQLTVPSEAPTPTAEPTGTALPSAPQQFEFVSEDGTPLAGVYYPPLAAPAPGILLMTQMGATKEIWSPLPALLQGIAPISLAESSTEVPRYAVFAFDWPGHGESGGTWSPQSTLAAARSALALFRTFEEVDPDRIVLIGASIGADAAVDECNEGCVGAISLSPGSYLGVLYDEALAELREAQNPAVLCIASEEDGMCAETCRQGESVGLSDYRVHIYEGNVHGNALLFEADLVPPPLAVDLIMEWLTEHLPAS
jgi:hypothetical protein